MKQEYDDVSQCRHHLGRRSLPDPTGILSQCSIAHAVEPVLNSPVSRVNPNSSDWTSSLTIKAGDSKYDLRFDPVAYPALSGKPKDLVTAFPVRSQILGPAMTSPQWCASRCGHGPCLSLMLGRFRLHAVQLGGGERPASGSAKTAAMFASSVGWFSLTARM